MWYLACTNDQCGSPVKGKHLGGSDPERVRRVSSQVGDEECMGVNDTSILIVEDHDQTRSLLMAALTADYECTSASSVEEAIRLIDVMQFDLVIIDVHMSGASGLEVCRLVSDLGLDTIIIAITGMTDLGYRLRATRQGVWYCLERPIDPEKLLVYIKAGLRCQAIARLRHHGGPTSSNARGIVVS
jgi:DNA-binding response OmpR family regulator